MGVAVSTIEVNAVRRWRDYDWQLTLTLLLLIGFGIVLGISASWNDPSAPGVVPQPVKTVIWTVLGLAGALTGEWRIPAAAGPPSRMTL